MCSCDRNISSTTSSQRTACSICSNNCGCASDQYWMIYYIIFSILVLGVVGITIVRFKIS